jgi:ABC-2 type transport system permease protein
LYLAFLRYCLVREMEYRASFVASLLRGVADSALNVLLFSFVFRNVQAIGDWTLERMLLLVGTYDIVTGLLYVACWPNMNSLSTWVNKGELDLVLTKPVASQFYVSLRRVELNVLGTVLFGVGLAVYAVRQMGLSPHPGAVAAYLVLVGCGVVICYAAWFSSILAVFWTGRLRNIQHIFEPVVQLARVPTTALRPPLRQVLTFALPLAFVATVPAQGLVGVLEPWHVPYGVLAAGLALFASNRWWHFALRRYSSASS